MQKWTDHEGFKPHKEWLLETDGTNLAEVMTFPAVNHRTTVSNDVLEMFQVLGIEGARSSLFNELRNVLSFDGTSRSIAPPLSPPLHPLIISSSI